MKYNAISLFSGAMGLDLGIEKSGFEIKVALEFDKKACETIKLNRPNIPIICDDIKKVSTKEILKTAKLKKEEVTLVFGGPPCQSFSTAGKRNGFNDEKGNVLLEFIRVVEEIKPKFFIFENVKGLLSAALKHRPINKRGGDFPKLEKEEEFGTVLTYILKRLEKAGYQVDYRLLNSADYGIPQKRERVFFIGSRDGSLIKIPEPTHNQKGEHGLKKWVSFEEVFKKFRIERHDYVPYSHERMKYMKYIPKGGGNWRNLPEEIQEVAMGGAFNSTGGRVGFYRRINANQPSPTLLTSPIQKSTNLGHPFEDRPLSIQEYKKIQQFPDDWIFYGNMSDIYKQIGNAVPVGLGYVVGKTIIEHIKLNEGGKVGRKKSKNCGERTSEIL